ncbi:MAG TPA: glycosyltransferase [Gemmatimonadales bacterium]|nr:glycosyltransferase [Gemmatimonadales bacterium]
MRRPVVIYRDVLLAPSETFVRAQAEALVSFEPHYVGSRRAPGLELPPARTTVINRGTSLGRVRELAHKSVGLAPALTRHLRALAPALVHAHFGPDGTLALPLARRMGAPLIVTFHGYDATMHDDALARGSWAGRAYVRRRARLWREASLVLAVSEFVRQKLEALGCPPERIRVHYIGIDTGFYRPAPEMARRPLVLFVGRLMEVKGCEYLLRAMRRVQAEIPDAHVVVIGDGPLRGGLEAFARAELEQVCFLGMQPPEVVRAWMNRARVFCVPSVTTASGATEGFGLVFAEAQAMGVPVAGFASGGVPEAVAHGETGLLVPERQVDQLADAITCLLRDTALWQRFSAAGRRRVQERFDLARQTERLEELYREVAL